MTEEVVMEAREPSLKRTIERAFFPMSPAATASEAILSDLIRGVSGTKAPVDGWPGLKKILEDKLAIKYNEDVATQFVRGAEAAYTRVNTSDSRKKNKNRYLVPFHPDVGRFVRPPESRRWQDWYAMLMCDQHGRFNEGLHDELLARLDALEPSNVVEQVIVQYLERDEGERKPPPGVIPYNIDLAKHFQEDLAAWLKLNDSTSYEWLQGLGFILTTYIMLDFIQLALNLNKEYDSLGSSSYEARVMPVYFGMDEDVARSHRSFTNAWNGIETSLYESWGNLAALRTCINAVGGVQRPHEFAEDNAPVVLKSLNDELEAFGLAPAGNVAEAMKEVANCVHKHYQAKTRPNQTPISLGINVVYQLGAGYIKLIYKHRGVGTTLRLSREALVLLTRICTLGSDDAIHLPAFFKWLEQRSIKLDQESQKLCLEVLEQLGFVERHSDAGDAVYVRSI